MDYLEKIIQLPYQVPVGVGMENYILEQMGKLKGNVKDEVDQNEGLPSGSRSNQEENDESNTDTRSEGVPLDSNTNLSTEVIPQIKLKFTQKEHRILTEASDIIKLTPRVAKRIVSVSKLLKIVWYHRPIEGLLEQMKT